MTTHDVVIVGGGFWGTATAMRLADRGLDVVVIDDGRPDGASRAAAGIVQWAWYRRGTLTAARYPTWWTGAHLAQGRVLLERIGIRQTGEYFINACTPGRRTFRPDMWLISSPQALLSQVTPVRDTVMRIVPGRRVTVHGRDRTYSGHWCVVAAGAATDELLVTSGLPPTGVRPLPGRAYLYETPDRLEVPVTYLPAPYRHLTARPFGELVRVGDTVERTPASRAKWEEMVHRTVDVVIPGARLKGYMEGVRPVLDRFVAEQVADGVIVATGGHRVGLGLAGGVAARIEDCITRRRVW